MSDWDQNGVIYYLGSLNYKKQFENPAERDLIRVFGSNLRSGNLQDLTNRQLNNITSGNSEHSYIGIDLLEDKELLLESYSIRNRASSTHCLCNWVLEASIDGHNYYIIDQRVHHTNDTNFNQLMAVQLQKITTKASVHTYHLDSTHIQKLLNQINQDNNSSFKGFRFFKIIQLFKNTHNTFNLSISNIELYGLAYGVGFHFP